jgi:hypothetical protein
LISANDRKKQIEEELKNMEREWNGKLEKIREDMERVLTENEMKEYRSRLAILTAELNDKKK